MVRYKLTTATSRLGRVKLAVEIVPEVLLKAWGWTDWLYP
jgi:hypothetical protein